MAQDGGTGEKTEEATPERLRKLREEGNVIKSQDIISSVSFLVVFIVLGMSFRFSAKQIIDFFFVACHYAFHPGLYDQWVMPLFWQAMINGFKACAPALLTAFLMGIVLNVAQVGFIFSTKPITPDFNRLNPVNGFKNMFNMKKVVELLKNIIKFVVISYFSYTALKRSIRDVTLSLRTDILTTLKVMAHIIWDFVSRVGIVFILIAAFDAFYQRMRYMKDNRMTKYDVQKEYKESEGDPQQKADRKRLHQEILSGGGAEGVKRSNVVIRNPTHLAVALKYESHQQGAAPEIIAKGQRLWAEQILEAARIYNIPIVHNVPLAQALFKLKIGEEIPEALYEAVAEVLTFIYTLDQQQKNQTTNKAPLLKNNADSYQKLTQKSKIPSSK